MTMPEFAKFIAGVLQAPVADQTELTGTYEIEMTPPRMGGEDGKVARVTGILLNELGLQLAPFAGPFSAEENDFDKEAHVMRVQRLPDGSVTNIDSGESVAANVSWMRTQLSDGSYTNIPTVPPPPSDTGYAIKLDHSDAPGLKASTEDPDSAAQGFAFVYDLDMPGIPAAVANKLRLIDAAKQQWALENRKRNSDTPTWQDISPYLFRGANGDLSDFTNSPDGRYIIGAVGAKPRIHANSLAPDSAPASKVNACINNLRLIDSAKQQWALEARKTNTDTPTEDDLRPYLGRGAKGEMPSCPDGGAYTFGAVGEKPTCSVQGHALP
jgi:hypothetical protein